MKLIRKIVLLSFLLPMAIYGHAQTLNNNTPAPAADTTKPATIPPPPPRPYVYKPKPHGPKPIHRELSVGFRLNTDGWGAFIDRGTVLYENIKTADFFYHFNLWQLEFDEKKDPREMKSTSTDQNGNTSSYIFGKINNFYTLKIGLGGSKMIAGKPDPGAVSIHWIINGGVSAGLLKPYYINANYNNVVQPIKYTEQTEYVFTDPTQIEGSAGFSQGLNETKIVPGVHLKTGLHFDFSGNRRTVLAAEVGMNAEYYSSPIQIMAQETGVPYFFNLYASFQVGKRW
jgi:hypothetical protein